MAIGTEPDPIIKNPKAPPVAKIKNPSSGKLENIYKNIENDALINKIKALEGKIRNTERRTICRIGSRGN